MGNKTAKEVWNRLKELGYTPRLVSPNKKGENQYYECKVGEENQKEWRIDAVGHNLDISAFMDGMANVSFKISLSEIADKVGVELCDEYSIGFNIWGHDEDSNEINLFTADVERLEKFRKDCEIKFKEFLKLCKKAIE